MCGYIDGWMGEWITNLYELEVIEERELPLQT